MVMAVYFQNFLLVVGYSHTSNQENSMDDDESVTTLTFQWSLDPISTDDSLPNNKIGELALLKEERQVLLDRSKRLNFIRRLAWGSVVVLALCTVTAATTGAFFGTLILFGCLAALIRPMIKLSDAHSEAVQELNAKYIPPQLESAANKEMEDIMADIDHDLE